MAWDGCFWVRLRRQTSALPADALYKAESNWDRFLRLKNAALPELVAKESLTNQPVARTHHYFAAGVTAILADKFILVEALNRIVKAE